MKTALITGGTKGIGKAVALAFLQQGYEVVINYHSDEETALATQEEFNIQGYCPILLRADVSDEMQVRAMFREFFGIYNRLDVLVNNAGISLIRVIQDTAQSDWDKVFGVNVKGVFNCCRAVADKMIGCGGGSIINIGSIWGEVGASCEAAYSASKGAVIAFTKALAKELAPSKVRVNCVSPGVIDTGMNSHLTGEEMEQLIESIPAGRIGYPEDVAK
ncbi:MAG: SDR family NAD(P)-dependent oxidoreductase, partial [Clostridia bacterium]|nr:SDR family NAD(P)-dependent oxidoreductase [Clostridia bacterium]